jgi:hypothetical protein
MLRIFAVQCRSQSIIVMTSPRYARCPKCDHAPLPHDQAFPAACPACRLILAKFAAAPTAADLRTRQAEQSDEDGEDEGQGRMARITATLTHVPARVDPLNFWTRVVVLVLFTLWGLSLIAADIRTGAIFNTFLHKPLLVFHEAGHVVFMLFGQYITVAGGTLGQLILPVVLMVALLRKGDAFGGAIGFWLLGVSVLDVAPYVYDAKEPYLILLGGHTGETGGHDWIHLLSPLGLREYSQTLGWWIHKLGALMVLAALGWGGWLLKQQKARLGETLEEGSL